MGDQVKPAADGAVTSPRPSATTTPVATTDVATTDVATTDVATTDGDGRGTAGASDRIFDALGEPVRRRILELLREGPVAVGVLAAQLPVGRPAVSKHLRLLSGAGLVEHRSVGTKNLYALAPLGLVEAQRWLVATWGLELSSYADHIENRAATGARSARSASTGKRATRKPRAR
jgi:DNA-binding transcriptional ArsR family regulator